MDRQAGLEGGGRAIPWPRAFALLGCAALAGLIVWTLARRSDDDTSLVIEGPRSAAAAIQIEQHALLPDRERLRQELAAPDTRRSVWNEPDAGLSARVPEPVSLPPAPRAPAATFAPEAQPALHELPTAQQLPTALHELPTGLDLAPAPAELTALDEALPPSPDQHERTSDAGTTSITAAKASPPPPPRPLRGTNNAPIFD